jgi:hypothetical protein
VIKTENAIETGIETVEIEIVIVEIVIEIVMGIPLVKVRKFEIRYHYYDHRVIHLAFLFCRTARGFRLQIKTFKSR